MCYAMQLKAEQEQDGSGDHDVERFSKDELKELMDAVCSWKTDNRDTVGQLWYKLLRLECVECQLSWCFHRCPFY